MITARGLQADRPNPVTCTGHADLVQTQNGEWFAVFLACQPYEKGFYNTGRETFMLPVNWENDWPTILPPHTPVPFAVKKPKLPADKPAPVPSTGNIAFTDNFDSDALAFSWVGLRAPTSKWYAVSNQSKGLFLEPRADLLSGRGAPSFLAVRQRNNDFTCSVTLTAQPKSTNSTAGLVAFQNEGHYYAINVKIDSGHIVEISLEQPANTSRASGGRVGVGGQPNLLATQKLEDDLTSIELEIEGSGPVIKCFFKAGSGGLAQLGQDLPASFLSTDTAGGFQGVTLGMFAHN
jgi:alpha-N-arabinofuranosidase